MNKQSSISRMLELAKQLNCLVINLQKRSDYLKANGTLVGCPH